MRHSPKGLLLLIVPLLLAAAWSAGTLAARRAPTPPVPFAFGTDVRVSADNPGQPHNDPVGAADPLNPLHFVVGATDSTSPTVSLSGAYFTTDGGQTWGGGNLLGPYPPDPQITPSGEVRVGIRGGLWAEHDLLQGTLTALEAKEVKLRHPTLGALTLPRDRVAWLRPVK